MYRYGNKDFIPVILGSGLGAYSIARALHEAYGIRSLALGRSRLPETQYSRIIDVRVVENFGTEAGVLENLEAVAAEFSGVKLLLIPTIEFYTNAVTANYEQLSKHYVIVGVEADVLQKVMDKDAFYDTCDALQIPYPRTQVLPVKALALGEMPKIEIDYPLILKPSNTDIYQRLPFPGRKKVYLLDSAAEVRETARKIYESGYEDTLILQEFLRGDEEAMRVVNLYASKDCTLNCLSIAQILVSDNHPARVGNYNAVATVYDQQMSDTLARLIKALGFHGTANFDLLLDKKTGQYKVLEMNVRLGAAHYYINSVGVNIMKYVVSDLIYGKRLPTEITKETGIWINEPLAIVMLLCPRSLRPLLRRGLRSHRPINALHYRKDMSAKRAQVVAKIEMRAARDSLKYRKGAFFKK